MNTQNSQIKRRNRYNRPRRRVTGLARDIATKRGRNGGVRIDFVGSGMAH